MTYNNCVELGTNWCIVTYFLLSLSTVLLFLTVLAPIDPPLHLDIQTTRLPFAKPAPRIHRAISSVYCHGTSLHIYWRQFWYNIPFARIPIISAILFSFPLLPKPAIWKRKKFTKSKKSFNSIKHINAAWVFNIRNSVDYNTEVTI